MSKTLDEIRDQLDYLLDSEDPLSMGEVQEVSRLSYILGEASVYNQQGLEYTIEEDL